jgi:hypothetical protein
MNSNQFKVRDLKKIPYDGQEKSFHDIYKKRGNKRQQQ